VNQVDLFKGKHLSFGKVDRYLFTFDGGGIVSRGHVPEFGGCGEGQKDSGILVVVRTRLVRFKIASKFVDRLVCSNGCLHDERTLTFSH
jgi:hypothetical protein